MRLLRSCLTVGACLFTFAGTVYQGAAVAKDEPATYPAQVVQAFTDACTAGGSGKVNPELMKKVCGCAIDEIQSQYTLDQFVAVAQNMEKTNTMNAKVTKIVQGCVEQAIK
jgi:hypothetical protein